MFFIIEILHNIPSKKKRKSQFFFSKFDIIYEKKALLASFYLDCTVKREGGDVHGFGETPMQEFFFNFATPSALCPNGQPQILSPHKPFFHLYVSWEFFGLDVICRAGPYFSNMGKSQD
jgi:hypothetical protein